MSVVLELANELSTFGGKWFAQMTNDADFLADVELMKNVKTPTALPKLKIKGSPRPYRTQKDGAGNEINIADRILTAYQSKWDFEAIDVEVMRNTYLAKIDGGMDPQKIPFAKFVTEQLVKSYWAAINDDTFLLGVRNPSGTNAAAIFTGIGTIIADEITAGNLEAIVTGVITDANAVSKIDSFHENLPSYVKNKKLDFFCSWGTFEKYRRNYRSEFGFTFDPNQEGEYKLDGKSAILKPRSWMGNSERLIATPSNEKNLFVGIDGDNVKLYPTPVLNTLDVRAMLPIGAQIADLDAIWVNDRS